MVSTTEFEQRLAALRSQEMDRSLVHGSSSWQSLRRSSGSIEAEYLNGEIALLGRLHGFPTPINAALQSLANKHAARMSDPARLNVDVLKGLL